MPPHASHPVIARSRTVSSAFSALVLLGVAGVFTTLVMHRAGPQYIHAGGSGHEERLADGTVLRLAPGGTVEIVRDFSLWGGRAARPRLIRWVRGEGRIETSDDTRPFYLVTADARFDVTDGIIDITASDSAGTEVRVRQGRLPMTTRAAHDLRQGVLTHTGATALIEPGVIVHVLNGAYDISDDVAAEDDVTGTAGSQTSG